MQPRKEKFRSKKPLIKRIFEQLFSDGTEKALGLFRSITNDEDTFIARLAKIATDLRLEDWDDNTHGRFTKNITRYKEAAEKYHSKTEQNTDTNSENNYQVTFIDEMVDYIRKIIATVAKKGF